MVAVPIELSPGVLAKSQMKQLFASGAISFGSYGEPNIDGSAFDLRLGAKAWQVTEAQRPTTRALQQLKAISSPIKPKRDQRGEYFIFEKDKIYLIESDVKLKLPSNIYGRATGKSSIGRLDVIARLLTNNSKEYDVVNGGYEGLLHLLVVPQTFSIIIKVGASLNQLRLFSGAPHGCVITRSMIRDFGTPFWYVAFPNKPYKYQRWNKLLDDSIERLSADPTLYDLTVDLADPRFPFIYKAISTDQQPNRPAIDLRKRKKSLSPKVYFEKIKIVRDSGNRSVVLDQGSFYIMKSKERLSIPKDVAVNEI